MAFETLNALGTHALRYVAEIMIIFYYLVVAMTFPLRNEV